MAMTTQMAFDAIARERVTETGRACVDLASRLFAEDPEKARAWVRLAMEGDKATLDAKLAEEIEKNKAKADVRGKARAAASSARAKGNVVAMPVRASGEDTV